MTRTPVAPLDPLNSNRRLCSWARIGIAARLILKGRTLGCRMEYPSVAGARLVVEGAPKLGTQGILAFRQFEIFGEVVWLSRGRTGFQFDEPLDDQHVIQMRHLAPEILRWERGPVERLALL